MAFISANLGAIEILGMSASGAQYGVDEVHYYWIGAIPAMVFLGIVMMPFYYGSKVRSVPEYLRLRFDKKAHLINAIIFVAGSLLIAGVNLYALATVLDALLGHAAGAGRRAVRRVRAVLHPARRADQRDLHRGDAVLRHPHWPDPAGRSSRSTEVGGLGGLFEQVGLQRGRVLPGPVVGARVRRG